MTKPKISLSFLPIFVVLQFLSSAISALENMSAKDDDLGGVKSFYTRKISDLITKTAAETSDYTLKAPISVVCIKHPDDSLYIGIKQTMKVNAPISQVQTVVEDINGYTDLFPGYKEIKIAKREGNNLLTQWEQIVPVPFVSNIKYEMLYRFIDQTNSIRVYRYQLNKESTIKASDGFIMLRPINGNQTIYTEYDFFNADWGAAKMLGDRKIWFDSIEGLAQSDVATKLKAEHPDFSNKKARSKGSDLVTNKQIDSCYRHRTTFDDGIRLVESLQDADTKPKY